MLASMTHLIEATGLRKRYGDVAALDGLDLAVDAGHVVGLLGPNGAGKTTALRILVGLVKRGFRERRRSTVSSSTSGWVAGERVGAMVATPGLLPAPVRRRRTCASSPRPGAGLGHEPKRGSGSALALVDLTAAADRAAKGYSTGMRQRLGIALALLADAPLLILDEPVNGLDPAGIVEIRDLLRRAGRRRSDDPRLEPPADRGRADLRPRHHRRPRPDRGERDAPGPGRRRRTDRGSAAAGRPRRPRDAPSRGRLRRPAGGRSRSSSGWKAPRTARP